MKINVSAVTLCALLAGASNASFGEQDLLNEKMNISIKNYSGVLQSDSADYQRYKREQEAKIKENDKKIADLKNKMSKEKQAVKDKYNERISKLEQRNKDMKKKIADHKKDENSIKWEAFKRDFNKGMDDLGQAIKDLTSEYKK